VKRTDLGEWLILAFILAVCAGLGYLAWLFR
jgi:hypothetical protein